MYTMWRYFDDVTCNVQKDITDIKRDNQFSTSTICNLNAYAQVIEQKIKDGLQSNAVCCRSGIDRLTSRISLLEKKEEKPRGRTTSRKDNA